MSIHPKIAIKGKDDVVKLHMKVTNRTNEKIHGIIRFRIKRPDGKIDTLQRKVCVDSNSQIDEYFKYPIGDKPEGKYIVDGRFYWDEGSVRSETWKNDFFEIKSMEVKK